MIYNLTHEINSGMPVFPGTEKPVISNIYSIEKNGFSENSISFMTHTGTHIDAPAHIIPEGKTLDQFEISKFKGKAFIIDINNDDIKITAKLENKMASADFIIFRTGWNMFWGQQKYFDSFPVPSSEIIEICCSLKLKGVGIDTASIDRIDSTSYENHKRLFSSDMIIIENMNNLSEIKQEFFELTALPLPVSGSDGSPAGVIAEV